MANSTVQPGTAPANENTSTINLALIKSMFGALPDADQVRFLAALYDEIQFDADSMHDALRDMAEAVSGFHASDDYRDLLGADDIYPGTIHDATERASYRTGRDRRLEFSLVRLGRRAVA